MFITSHYPTSNVAITYLNFDTAMKKGEIFFTSKEK